MTNKKIACLGPAASFSHLAALEVFGEANDYVFKSQHHACKAAIEKSVNFAVIPIENNVGGFVDASLDALYWNARITIVDQIYLPIQHNLISRAKNINDIDVIYSHPQAFAQCRRTLEKINKVRVNPMERKDVTSTSRGVQLAKENPRAAAIAAKEAAILYNVPILKNNFQDNDNNTTRFYVNVGKIPKPSDHDRSSFLFEVKHQPGALTNILFLFAENKINLLSIATRPLHHAPAFNWNYAFFLECEGHIHKQPLSNIYRYFQEMRTPYQERKLRLLGSFPDRAISGLMPESTDTPSTV